MNGDATYGQFVDLASLKKHPPKVDYWMLQVNLAETATKPRYVSHALRQYTMDCSASTTQMTYSILYLGSGSPLGRQAIKSAPQPIPPDTVSAEVEDLLCHGKSPSQMVVHSVDEARALVRKLDRQLPKL
jgi:hypothetical protein